MSLISDYSRIIAYSSVLDTSERYQTNTVKLTRAGGHTYRRNICLTSSLIPNSDCNSTSSAGIYFSLIICVQFRQYCLSYCKDARTLKFFI